MKIRVQDKFKGTLKQNEQGIHFLKMTVKTLNSLFNIIQLYIGLQCNNGNFLYVH